MMVPFDSGPSKRYLELVSWWTKKLTKDGYGRSKVFNLSRKYARRDLKKENEALKNKPFNKPK